MQTLNAEQNADNYERQEQEEGQDAAEDQSGGGIATDQAQADECKHADNGQGDQAQHQGPCQKPQASDSTFNAEGLECGELRQFFADAGLWRRIRGVGLSRSGMVVNIGQVKLDRRFRLDPGIDASVFQGLEVGLRIRLGQVALECYRSTIEQALDGADVALEQRSEIEFGAVEINTRQQCSVEHDLVTVFAHCPGILVASHWYE
ncbi:hypothetical protein D3C76_1042290 [compost metagenome]